MSFSYIGISQVRLGDAGGRGQGVIILPPPTTMAEHHTTPPQEQEQH